jgi:transcription antitermination factor NusG
MENAPALAVYSSGGGKVKDRKPQFLKGDRVRISPKSASPYRGCSGVVERVVEEKSGLLYIVQFGKSGELTLTDNFLEDNLQTIAI